MGDHWEYFKRAFLASIQNIDEQYFLVRRHDAPPVWRERVCCYELYHQLRCRLGESTFYTVHGELDKRGQAIFSASFVTIPNPDFVIHVPGTMGANLVVIEVKPAMRASPSNLKRDLEKLREFVETPGVEYGHGILLIFGQRRSTPSLDLNHGPISVLWHRQVGAHPEVLWNEQEWILDA